MRTFGGYGSAPLKKGQWVSQHGAGGPVELITWPDTNDEIDRAILGVEIEGVEFEDGSVIVRDLIRGASYTYPTFMDFVFDRGEEYHIFWRSMVVEGKETPV